MRDKCPFAPVNTIAEVTESDQAKENENIIEFDHPVLGSESDRCAH